MARNKDRHFSEGDGLNAQDMGAYIPEEDERMPAWAQQVALRRDRQGLKCPEGYCTDGLPLLSFSQA